MSSSPSPFELSSSISENLGQFFKERRESSTIDDILERAVNSKNPNDLNQFYGQVISKVSPEKQKNVLAILQNKAAELALQKKETKRQSAFESAGIRPGLAGLPDTLAKSVHEQEQTDKRLGQIVGGDSGTGAVGGGGGIAAGVGTDQPGAAQGINFDNLSNDQLTQLTGVKGFSEPAKAELRNREADVKESRADKRDLRKETLPLRMQIAEKADAAREGIKNKENLIEIIDRGELNDPTYAAIAQILPHKLGDRLLSDDTVTYRAGIIDEFKDLRTIFKGQTRVKEIELLENKTAGIHLDDGQKKAILKSRMRALEADLIQEEAAQEIEEKNPNLGLIGFQRAVNALAKQKKEKLFNSILEEHKAIFKQAEIRKEYPLDRNNPEDMDIAKQIMKKAGGDRKKAEKIAKEQGYKF